MNPVPVTRRTAAPRPTRNRVEARAEKSGPLICGESPARFGSLDGGTMLCAIAGVLLFWSADGDGIIGALPALGFLPKEGEFDHGSVGGGLRGQIDGPQFQ